MTYSNIKTYLVLTLGLILSLSFAASAQTDFNKSDLQDVGELDDVLRTMKKTEVIGSPYLNPSFLKGEVLIRENVSTKPTYIRLNTEKNTVEFIRNEQIMQVDSKKIVGFRLYAEDGDLVFKNGFNTDVKGVNSDTFMRVLHDGKVKFLGHHKARLQEDLASYGDATQTDKYVKTLTYYIVMPNGDFEEVKLNKESILSVVPSKNEVETYANSNALMFDNEDDVAAILKGLDNIQ